MNKILKYLLFRIVLVVITLHAIIPHPHSYELTKAKHLELHKNSNSLVGIIRLAFHESNDENLDHLLYAQYEIVKKTDSKYTYPKLFIFNKDLFIVENIETEKIEQSNITNFKKLLFVKLNGLRGPPQFS